MNEPQIVIFGNSTSYDVMDASGHITDDSYINLLRGKYQVDGLWANGMTMLHARLMLPWFLKSRGVGNNWVIIHVGACEAFTEKAENFLELTTYWMNYYPIDSFFFSYVFPKMHLAAKSLTGNRKEYFRYFEPDELYELGKMIVTLVEGYTLVIVGMSEPSINIRDMDLRRKQSIEVNKILEQISKKFHVYFIDTWNITNGMVYDTNHFSKEGHQLIFNEIDKLLEESK